MKKISLLLFCIFEMFFLPVWGEEVDFAEVTQGSETNSGTDSFADSGEVETFFESDFDDSFDDLFSSAEDEVVENQTIPTTQETDTTQPAPTNMFYVPLKFTGSAEIDVGLGNVWDATGYHFVPGFEFSNTLSFTARISKNLGIQGSFDMSLPKFSFTVSELYFDYLIFDRLYLFGGKREITWGYPRLFSANILEDAVDNIVLSLDLPVWTGSFSAVFLYPPDKFDSMNVGSMSVVGAAEFVIFDTAIKLFGRKNPSLESYDNPEKYVGHIGGMEIKRSFWGVDTYIQTLFVTKDLSQLNNNYGYQKVNTVFGFYKWWETTPKVGFNVEYQHTYTPHEETVQSHRVSFAGGVSRLGKNKNTKIGIEWNHLFVKNEGDVTLACVVNGLFPHAEWQSGLEILYGGAHSKQPKITLGTGLKIKFDY